MKKTNIAVIFWVASIFISCVGCKDKRETKKIKEPSTAEDRICVTKSEKESIIIAILNTEDFQMFLHPDVEGRLPVKLVKNDFVTPDLELKSNGRAVVLRDSLVLPLGDVNNLRIVEWDCAQKEFGYSVFYPIEGASMSGTVYKSDGKWLVKDATWGEIN